MIFLARSDEVVVKVVKARKLHPLGNFVLSIPRDVERVLPVCEDTKFIVKFSRKRSVISYELITK